MSATFVYVLFISLAIMIIGLMLYNYYLGKSVKKIQVNPINIILGSIFLMCLWLFDLTTLGISEHGISSPLSNYGVVAGGTRVPGMFVWGIVFFGMAIISIYYYLYNEKNHRFGFRKFNRYLIYTLFLGEIVIFLAALYMIFFGYASVLLNAIYTEGIYHSTLPLIIIPILVLMIDIK